MPDLNKRIEPRGNVPERSVATPRIIWWVLALIAILVFCLLAWWGHERGRFF